MVASWDWPQKPPSKVARPIGSKYFTTGLADSAVATRLLKESDSVRAEDDEGVMSERSAEEEVEGTEAG